VLLPQELNRVLCDKLDEKMKGTVVDGTIKRLFEGYLRSVVRCLNVDYSSKKTDEFHDIHVRNYLYGCITHTRMRVAGRYACLIAHDGLCVA
jgi:hypothetical protein